jgi:hypothetical protein
MPEALSDEDKRQGKPAEEQPTSVAMTPGRENASDTAIVKKKESISIETPDPGCL